MIWYVYDLMEVIFVFLQYSYNKNELVSTKFFFPKVVSKKLKNKSCVIILQKMITLPTNFKNFP